MAAIGNISYKQQKRLAHAFLSVGALRQPAAGAAKYESIVAARRTSLRVAAACDSISRVK